MPDPLMPVPPAPSEWWGLTDLTPPARSTPPLEASPPAVNEELSQWDRLWMSGETWDCATHALACEVFRAYLRLYKPDSESDVRDGNMYHLMVEILNFEDITARSGFWVRHAYLDPEEDDELEDDEA